MSKCCSLSPQTLLWLLIFCVQTSSMCNHSRETSIHRSVCFPCWSGFQLQELPSKGQNCSSFMTGTVELLKYRNLFAGYVSSGVEGNPLLWTWNSMNNCVHRLQFMLSEGYNFTRRKFLSSSTAKEDFLSILAKVPAINICFWSHRWAGLQLSPTWAVLSTGKTL